MQKSSIPQLRINKMKHGEEFQATDLFLADKLHNNKFFLHFEKFLEKIKEFKLDTNILGFDEFIDYYTHFLDNIQDNIQSNKNYKIFRFKPSNQGKFRSPHSTHITIYKYDSDQFICKSLANSKTYTYTFRRNSIKQYPKPLRLTQIFNRKYIFIKNKNTVYTTKLGGFQICQILPFYNDNIDGKNLLEEPTNSYNGLLHI